MKKFLVTLTLLPLVAVAANFNSVLETNADNVFDGVTFDYSTTNKFDYIDGATLIDALTNGTATEAEKAFVNKNYRVKYDLIDEAPFNYGNVNNEEFYVEALESDTVRGKNYKVGNLSPIPFEQITQYQRVVQATSASLQGNDFNDGQVTFEHDIKIDKNAANEILNAAYKVGLEQKQKDDAYNNYLSKKTAYENYETELQKYNQYEAALNVWKANNGNYQAYLNELNEYNQKLNQYNQYVQDMHDYQEDLKNYKAYKDALASYNANLELIEAAKAQFAKEMAQVDYQLNNIDCVYTRFPAVEEGGTVFSYVFRGAVDTVLTHQQDLTALGVPSTAIKKAGDATVAIRPILTSYDTLNKNKTDEGKAPRYNYLVKYFSTFRSNLVALTQCLEKFYQNSAVRAVIESQGKTQRYIYLVAELIYCSELLSDSTVYSYDWAYARTNKYVLDHTTVIDGKTVQQILGVDAIPTKEYKMTMLSSYPISVEQTLGKEPSFEDYDLSSADQPVKPTEVVAPVAPTVVESAGDPPDPSTYGASATRPSQPAVPGIEPEQRDTEYDDLFNLVKNNTLKLRNEFSEDKKITVEQTFNLCQKDECKIAVLCVVKNQKSEIYEIIFVDPTATSVNAKHEYAPEDNGDGTYKYIKEWTLPNGQLISLDDLLNNSAKIEAVFEENGSLSTYNVEWKDTSGNLLATTETFNELRPTYYVDATKTEVTPTKASTANSRFEFDGFTYLTSEGVEKSLTKNQYLPKADNMKVIDNKITVTVKFKEISSYNVNFVSNGSVVYELEFVDSGTRINYGGATPTKESTNTLRYEFDYWTVNGEKVTLPYEVTGDVVFVAHFKEIQKYKITFEYGDNVKETNYYEDGELIKQPDNVDKNFTDNYYYIFDEWDHAVTAASKNDIYVAKYEQRNIIENANITRSNGVLNVLVKENVTIIDISKFTSLLSEGYEVAPMNITFGDVTISFTSANVLALANNGVATISVVKQFVNNVGQVTVSFKKAGSMSVNGIAFDVTINNLEDTANIKFTNDELANSSKVITNTSIKFKGTANKDIKFGVFFKLSFYELSPCDFYINDEKINIHQSYEFQKGANINIRAEGTHLDIEGLLAKANNNQVIKQSTGNTIKIENIDRDLMIYSNTKNTEYTITFKSGDDVIASIDAAAGLTIALPTAFKAPDAEGSYIFTGWEGYEDQNSLVVTGDLILNATFELQTPENGEGITQSRSYTLLAGEVGLALVSVAFISGLLIVIFKKDKKEKKGVNNEK